MPEETENDVIQGANPFDDDFCEISLVLDQFSGGLINSSRGSVWEEKD